MPDNARFHDKRKEQRVGIVAKIKISIGTQLTVEGQIKDITLTSVFVSMRNNIYLNSNDTIQYEFETTVEGKPYVFKGNAYVTRIVKGEGFVISFSGMDDVSLNNLKRVLNMSV